MKDITTVYSITTWLLLKQLFDLSCSEKVANQSGQSGSSSNLKDATQQAKT